MRRNLFLLVVVGSIVACDRASSAPPARSAVSIDFENMCNAVERSGTGNIADPAQRAMRIADWLNQTMRTDEARRTLRGLSGITREGRRTVLRRAAHEAGYDGPCPMADGEP